VRPESIPDYLALVGDSADGFPGIPGWGKKSASVVLSRYLHLEAIPREARQWDVSVRGADALLDSLRGRWEEAQLFRTLATLRRDAKVFERVDELAWRGPGEQFDALCRRLNAQDTAMAARELARR
jgi:5'-3' exonuclease